MKVNLKNWKKIKSDDSYTYFQDHHRNELRVAHTTLSPKMRADLAALPVHMADGGEVEEDKKKKKEDEEIKNEIPLSQSIGHKIGETVRTAVGDALGAFQTVGGAIKENVGEPIANTAIGAVQGLKGEEAAPLAAPAPEQPVAAAPPVEQPSIITDEQPIVQEQAAPVAAPAQPQVDQSLMSKGMSNAMEGIRKEADASQKLAQAQAKALEVSIADQKALEKSAHEQYNTIVGELKQVTEDIKAGHIDPSRVWDNKSSMGKVSTAIGIMLSGIGSGLSGQSNMAMDVLNKEIDRDIDAQKANISNKNNMLHALSQQMGDLRQGTEMLRAIKLGVVADEMRLAAAKTNDPMAKATMLKSIGDLQMKAAEITSKLAVDRAKGNMTEGQKAVDAAFAKDYNEWLTAGKSSTDKNLKLLEDAKRTLAKREKDLVGTSGRVTGRLPDFLRSEESLRLRDDVQRAASGALKASLGSQFTEKEGERIMAQSYNEKLSPAENIKKIDAAIKEIKGSRDLMEERSSFYEQRGSLQGWKSPKSGEQEERIVQEAKKRLKANPNDVAARGYLQRRGLLK